MKKVHALFAALVMSSAIATQAAEVKLGSTPEWAPFTSDKLEAGGIAVAIATEAFARAQYTATTAFLPWGRVMDGVSAGTLDGANCMWPSDEDAVKYLVTDPVVVNRIIFAKAVDDTWEYDGLTSLDGKTVAIMSDYGYSQDFLDATNFTKEEGTSFTGNLKKVAAKRVDLTLEDEIVAKYTASTELGDVAAKLSYTQNALSEVGCVIGVSTANPQAQEIVDAFNKGLAEIQADGTYDEIMVSYGIK